jgi:hypothetical protein
LNLSLELIGNVCSAVFPDNRSRIIESDRVYISECPVFECSVERETEKDFHLTANFNCTEDDALQYLNNLLAEFQRYEIKYDIDFETIVDDASKEQKFVSPV